MKTNILRSVAVTLGMGACTVASGQVGGTAAGGYSGYTTASSGYAAPAYGNADSRTAGYQAPAKWSRFNPTAQAAGATLFQPVSAQAEDLPAPGMPQPAPAPGLESATGSGLAPDTSGTITDPGYQEPVPDGGMIGGRFLDAAGSAWEGATACEPGVPTLAARPRLSPWFGGFNLLFLDVEGGDDYRLVHDDADPRISRLWTSDVNPGADLGFDITVGRYLACGKYGVGVTYFNFDPDAESLTRLPANPGDYMASMPGWNNVEIDPSAGVNPAGVVNGGLDTVYNYFDAAAGLRVRRDLDVQGLEANLFCFGIMGAQRAASCGGKGLLNCFRGVGNKLGLHSGVYGGHCGPAACGPQYGFGGAAGPLVRPCNGRIQVVASHGFRWFQLEDAFGFDANIDGTTGYQPTDLFYDVETENNLFGYQFGGRLIYCLTNCLNFSVGGKFGLYGNDVEYRQRIVSSGQTANYVNLPTELVRTEASETVFSTLGELDLGLGYRLCSAWTLRGGYRLIGVTGVATGVGAIAHDFASVDPNRRIYADDSFVLHGGYVGAEYNW